MAFVHITAPTVGDPTRLQGQLTTLISNQADLNSRLSSIAVGTIVNGSFENDGDSDGVPDGWTYAAIDGGTGAISTDSNHGAKSYSMTVGTPAAGGASLTSTDFIPVKGGETYKVRFDLKSTADMSNRVTVLTYDIDELLVDSLVVYEEAAANPTSWTTKYATTTAAGATVRFIKIQIEGGFSGSAVGTCRWDDVALVEDGYYGNQTIYTADDTWVCPSNVTRVYLEGIGGGAGGGGGHATTDGAGGGGGGAYEVGYVATAPGTTYAITMGTAGTGGAVGANGVDGGATSFGALFSVLGGTKGIAGATGTGGAGGVGAMSSSLIGISGTAGSGKASAVGGNGGVSVATPIPSTAGTGGASGAAGTAGTNYGAGGGGGGRNGAGGDGSAGLLILRF